MLGNLSYSPVNHCTMPGLYSVYKKKCHEKANKTRTVKKIKEKKKGSENKTNIASIQVVKKKN